MFYGMLMTGAFLIFCKFSLPCFSHTIQSPLGVAVFGPHHL
jgi:hypothetical protein